jgi:hypothetical protein
MSFHQYSSDDSMNRHSPLPLDLLTSDAPPSPLPNSYTNLTHDGRSVPEGLDTLQKVCETYSKVSSQRNTQPIDNEFQEMVNEWWPTESPSSSVLPSPSPAPSPFRSKTMTPPSPPDIPYVPSSIGDEPMNDIVQGSAYHGPMNDGTLINDCLPPPSPSDISYVPSPPNGYSDLTHFPDLEMDNEHFNTFPKGYEPYQTHWNDLGEITDQACQYGFNEPMTYWGPSQPPSSPSFSLSNMPVMVPSGIPQTPAASSGLNRNTNNQERAASDLEEVPSNEGSLPKKPKHSPKGKGPVSVFQVLHSMPTKEENEFKEKLRKFLAAHAGDDENKKDENLKSLRQMAREYGEKIHNIDKIEEEHIQDLLIIQACLRGVSNRDVWSGNYYDQIKCLVTAMGFGLKLPDPTNHETQAEKNDLLGYIINLTKPLEARLSRIEKTSSVEKETNSELIQKLKMTIGEFKKIKEEVLSQITIATNQRWRANSFNSRVYYLKNKLNISTLEEGQPPLISLLQLMLCLPPPVQHNKQFSVQGPTHLRDCILDYLRVFNREKVRLFQSDDPEEDMELKGRFLDSLLQREAWLWKQAGASPKTIEAVKKEMKRLLQTTSEADQEPMDQACQYGFNEPVTHEAPPQPYSSSSSSLSNTPVMVSSGIPQTSTTTSSISNRNTKKKKRVASDSEKVSSNKGSLPKKPKRSPEGEGPVSIFQVLLPTRTTNENGFNNKLRTFLKAHATDDENKKDENLEELRQMACSYGKEEKIHDIDKTHIQDLRIMLACLRGIHTGNVPEEKRYDHIEYLVTAMGFGLKLPSPTNHKTQAEKNDLLGCMINLTNGLELRLREIKKISGTQSEKNCKLTDELKTTIQRFKEIQSEVRSQITIVTNQSWRVDVFNTAFWHLEEELKKREIEFDFPRGQPRLNNLLELMLLLPTPLSSRKVSENGLAYLRECPSDYLRAFQQESGVLVFQSDYPEIDMELRTQYFDRLLNKEIAFWRAAGATPEEIKDITKKMTQLLQTTPTA